MKLLFIGNSHTYYHSMPATVAKLLEATGVKTHVTMLTEGGKGLAYHATSPNTIFNIRYGSYDAIVVQDRATGFDPVSFKENAKLLKDLTDAAGAKFYLYMPWTGRNNRAAQRAMTDTYHEFCRQNGCLFAPAGEVFSRILLTEESSVLYKEDGNHATQTGSYLAALSVFYTVTGRKRIINVADLSDPGVEMGIPTELCQKIHTEACHMTRLYNG